MQNIPTIAGFLQCNHDGKLEEAEDFKSVFVVYCVFKSKWSALVCELFSNNSLFVCQLYKLKSLVLRTCDLIFTTDLQTVIYYLTIARADPFLAQYV